MPIDSEKKNSSGHEAFRRLFASLRGSTSYRALAERTNYDHSYLAKVERGERAPTRDLAEQLDRALGTRGELAAVFHRRPAQLPACTARFVGRQAELGLIAEATASTGDDRGPALVALCGSPGVGKTSIALHWARGAAASYPDGVLFADLRGYADAAAMSPSTVLERFLLALGIPAESVPEEETVRASLYRSLVDGRRVLVVLDNVKDSAQVRPLLPGAPGCAVLVTSRRRLSGLAIREGAAVVAVAPMDEADATTILADVAGSERIFAEREAANELARRCSYLPLALTVAGERVASNEHRALSDLVRDLEETGDRLDFLSADEDESTAVRAVFSWSYQCLSADTARMFRMLCLHPGPDCGVEAAAALANWPVARVRHHLDLLISMHLVERTAGGRYGFHELTRAYALECANIDEDEDARRAAVHRLLVWCLATATAANEIIGSDRARAAVDSWERAVSWCDEELASLTAVVLAAGEWGFPEFSHQLPAAMWEHYCLRGASKAWLEMNEAGRVRARDLGDDGSHALMLNNLGHGWFGFQRFERAAEYFDAALAVRRRIADRAGEGWSLVGLSSARGALGDHENSVRLLAEAVALFAELGEPWQDRPGEAQVRHFLAHAALRAPAAAAGAGEDEQHTA